MASRRMAALKRRWVALTARSLCTAASGADAEAALAGAVNLPPPRRAHKSLGIRSLKHCSSWPLYGEPFGEVLDESIAAPPNAVESATTARAFSYQSTRLIASVLDSRAHLGVAGLDYDPPTAQSGASSDDGEWWEDGDAEEEEEDEKAVWMSSSDGATDDDSMAGATGEVEDWAGYHDVDTLGLERQVAARRVGGDRAHRHRQKRWSALPLGGAGRKQKRERAERVAERTRGSASTTPFEVALVGRSNVGKSSLLNALLGLAWDDRRTQLAHVSRTPGKTRGANFWGCGRPLLGATSNEMVLVDLPGYGYAKGARGDADRMHDLIFDVVSSRAKKRSLNHALMLVDARRGMQDVDVELLQMMEHAFSESRAAAAAAANDDGSSSSSSGGGGGGGGRGTGASRAPGAVEFSIVLTKADHLTQLELVERIEATISELWSAGNAYPGLFAVSAASGYGIQRLRTHIVRQGLRLNGLRGV